MIPHPRLSENRGGYVCVCQERLRGLAFERIRLVVVEYAVRYDPALPRACVRRDRRERVESTNPHLVSDE